MLAAPGQFVVRNASEGDGPRLLELMGGSTDANGVRWRIEPGHDPFAALRAESDGWTVALAEDDDGRVLGFVSVARRTVFVGGRPRRTCYVTNLKVLPEHRGRGIGDALCWQALELCRSAGGESVPILMVIRCGNPSMRGRIAGPRGLPSLTKFANVEIHSVSVRSAARIPAESGLEVRPASPDDLEEMAALSTCVASGRQFASGFDATGLARWIEEAPGLTLGDHTVARSGGRIVGWIGWWDEVAVRVVRIAGFTPAGAVRWAIQDSVARLMGAQRPVGVGETVGCIRAVHACVPGDRPDVLRTLIAEGARRRAHDCSWLKIALDRRDPLTSALHGLRTRVAAFDAHLTSPSGSYDPWPLDDRPLHVEAALV
jgi:GNAT superfamily N-acetyltransferase